MKKIVSLLLVTALLLTLFVGCSNTGKTPETTQAAAETTAATEAPATEAPAAESTPAPEAETVDIQILATSDLHGKFVPWDYALNAESKSGSMAQLATAIKSLRNENTLVVDAGDTIQDNAADIFLGEEVHPMIAAMNAIGYDTWTTGNHEYNYGMETLKKVIASQKAKVLTGKEDRGRKVTFADVAGIDEAREEVQEIVEFLKDPGAYKRLGVRIPLVGTEPCAESDRDTSA